MNPASRFGLSPIVLGTGCCLIAAVGYTAVDVGVRSLSERQDLVWILFVKELVAVVLVGPWLLWQSRRGKAEPVGRQALVALAMVAALTHLAGNIPFFLGNEGRGVGDHHPGVARGDPGRQCHVGWFFLRERVSWQSGLAIAVTIASVVFLSIGAGGSGSHP